MKSSSTTNGQIVTREELIYALCQAAELEHGLMCVYLFAAFSMKQYLSEGIDEVQRDQIRNWEGVLLRVAKQEMEHLGFVCNMLNAIGAPQHFQRPNLPQRPAYYGTEALTLEPFNLRTMARFMEYEKPASSSDATAVVDGDQLVPTTINFFNHHTVQELYNAILQGFENLSAKLGKNLFIGPPEAQLEDSEIVVGYGNREFGITLFDVTDLASAKRAIYEIIEQGEGIDLDEPAGTPNAQKLQHLYQRIVAIQLELQSLTFTAENWQTSGQQLIASLTLLRPILADVRAVLAGDVELIGLYKDPEILNYLTGLLDAAMDQLGQIQAKAEEVLAHKRDSSQAATLQRLCRQAVRMIQSDVAGIVLTGVVNPDSHYLQFWRVYEELRQSLAENRCYEPGRRVVSNPALRIHEDNAAFARPNAVSPDDDEVLAVHIVTHPYTVKVLDLFNAAYETTVQMLLIVFSYNGISEADRTLLINTAFFPFMTMVIRPMSELLTQLPAYAENKEHPASSDALRAGPSFEYYNSIAFLPNRDAGWIYLQERLDQMVAASQELVCPPRDLEKYLPAEQLKNLQTQMSYLSTNLSRIAQNFASQIQK